MSEVKFKKVKEVCKKRNNRSTNHLFITVINCSSSPHQDMTAFCSFNVGGTLYDVAKTTILKFEDTMLAKLVSDKWNKGNEVIFIDRDGERFKYILDWYRNGKIIVPRWLLETVRSDVEYFGLPEDAIEQSNSLDDHLYSLRDAASYLGTVQLKLQKMNQETMNENFAIW